ncbi:MAG: hypothetical protein SGJ05_06780 [bacterium]|nr:hypothetical protein [bacterium]
MFDVIKSTGMVQANMIKLFFTVLVVLVTTTVTGQTRDRRAEVSFDGNLKEVAVTPSEKIWIVTSNGSLYSTENIDSTWHYRAPILLKDPLNDFSDQFERLSFFDDDNAIATGYIQGKERDRNGLYRTSDAGKSWTLVEFEGDSWIYCAFVNASGRGWIGGSSGSIYYTEDFGKTWRKLDSPYDSTTRLHYIQMVDKNHGISGALGNEIHTTHDNWKTTRRIATPVDRNKYTAERAMLDDRIEKVLLWDKYVVVNQGGHVYYSDTSDIEWKAFPVHPIDFALDSSTNYLFVVTDSFQVISYSSPFQYQTLTNDRLRRDPDDIKVVNRALFVGYHNGDVAKVTASRLVEVMPFTKDSAIVEPTLVRQGTTLKWGISGNNVYLSSNTEPDWYREHVLNINVDDFRLESDSVAVLRDHQNNHYLYSLRGHTISNYVPASPLSVFMSCPVKLLSMNVGTRGCFHGSRSEFQYHPVSTESLGILKYATIEDNHEKNVPYKNTISISRLQKELTIANAGPGAIPPLSAFRITKQDKKSYLRMVSRWNDGDAVTSDQGLKRRDILFYRSVPSLLDTLRDEVVNYILSETTSVFSTTRNWIVIHLVNRNDDTLKISRYYYTIVPWLLPWEFEYKGQRFNCYNVEFSRLVRSMLPEDFFELEAFDNKYLILDVANYLYFQKRKRSGNK